MFQSYPSGGKPVEPERPPAPPTVQNAVKLMYAGAAVSTVYLIVSLLTLGDIKGEIKKADPKLTASQVASSANFLIITTIIFGIVTIGLWLWMAWGSKEGKNWARIASTAFCILYALYILSVFARVHSIAFVLPALEWLTGLAAVILLWRRESSEFFNPPRLL
jgi:magnesium-transporting ATPase (P-type)